jgi:hypothetical protein
MSNAKELLDKALGMPNALTEGDAYEAWLGELAELAVSCFDLEMILANISDRPNIRPTRRKVIPTFQSPQVHIRTGWIVRGLPKGSHQGLMNRLDADAEAAILKIAALEQ